QRMLRNITGKHDEVAALTMPARDFNFAAEAYYRDSLKQKLLREGLRLVMTKYESDADLRGGLYLLLGDIDVPQFIRWVERSLTAGTLSQAELSFLIKTLLVLVAMEMDAPRAESIPNDYATA